MASPARIAADEPVRDQRPASPSSRTAAPAAEQHAAPAAVEHAASASFAAPAARAAAPPADDPLAGTLARAVARRGARLQRKAKQEEEGWLDSLWETVGDAIESVKTKVGELIELSEYPTTEAWPPKPEIGAWFGSKGLEAIRNRKGLLSKSKLPRGDKAAAPLVRQAVRAWGAETFGRDLLPVSASSRFDAEADAAVRHLQRNAGLTGDGVVGPMTLAILDDFVLQTREGGHELDEGDVDPHTVPIVGEGFSEQEELWIRQVWALPEIQALYGLYPTVPRQILIRVDKIVDAKTGELTASQGIHREGGEEIEIADNTYGQPEGWNPKGPRHREAQFKTVLIHELLHVFEGWSGDIGLGGLKIRTPAHLVADMYEEQYGWFIHPNADKWPEGAQQEAHYSWMSLDAENSPDYYLPKFSKERFAMERGGWEASPDLRGAEEDVATCLGMYLGSDASKEHLRTAFPRRFKLVDEYMRELLLGAEGRVKLDGE